jgi:antitoxin (DNA-binding transcriptional repressor) of toxin-antitoxin stability system
VNGAGSRVGLEELRTRAGRCFDRVAAGETIEVVWGGRLVARLVSVAGHRVDPTAPRTGNATQCAPVQLEELRRKAGRHFDRVAAGEIVEVVRAGRVVARIVSATGDPRASMIGDGSSHIEKTA